MGHRRHHCPRLLGRGAANEGSTTGGDETEHSLPGLDDSLPELISDETETSEDSGYDFLNTPTNEEDKDFEASPEEATETTEEEEKEQEKVNTNKNTSDDSEETQLQDSIDFILNMEDPDYKDPEPCTGLTCPLTGEQYYVD